MLGFLKKGFAKLSKALQKTRSNFVDRLKSLLSKPLDEETLEEIEALLYHADLGSEVIEILIKEIKSHHSNDKTMQDYIALLENRVKEILNQSPKVKSSHPQNSVELILIVGINGSGKTTTAAKLGYLYKKAGKKVLIAALDTFRAAAIEQLQLWCTKLGLDIILSSPKADPASVMFDALSKAKAKGYDIVIADTAGRLESKTDLMKELQKIASVAKKFDESAPHQSLFVVDATTGQSAMHQITTFKEFIPITGMIITKLDGSAKGGFIVPIYQKHKIPITHVGLGEGEEDLDEFNADLYVKALFSN